MNFPIIVLDLDGTLLNSKKEISKRNYNAIMNCSNMGMKFIFATARPPRAVRSFISEDMLNLGSFIYYNGAYIDCKHTGINKYISIESEVTAELLDYCLHCNPDLDLSLEVKDEWMTLMEYDYSAVIQVKDKPSVKPLEELRRLDTKSRAIPEKLGFKREGELRDYEYINGRFIDRTIYGLKADEWRTEYSFFCKDIRSYC